MRPGRVEFPFNGTTAETKNRHNHRKNQARKAHTALKHEAETSANSKNNQAERERLERRINPPAEEDPEDDQCRETKSRKSGETG
jgi:hypothetical protein